MTGLKNYQHWSYTIPIGGEIIISTSGHYLVCLDATAAFEVGVDGSRGQFLESGLGFFMPQGEEFQRVIVTNTSGAPNTIKLAIGRGNFKDSRLSLTGKVGLTVAANIDDSADTAIANAVQTAIAGSVNQREIIIQADPGNTGNLRVAASAVGSRGAWLQPGQSIALATAATVYVTNDSGGSLNYAFMKVID